MLERLVFVGPGRVGLAMGYALVQAEAVEELEFWGRRPEPPGHPLFVQGLAEYRFGLRRPAPGTTAVLLTVPDDVLPELAHTLAAQGEPPGGCVAMHCSGALSADILGPLHSVGYVVGSLHPLQALAHPLLGADRLPGSSFALSGEPGAVAVGRGIVAALSGRVLQIPVSQRPTYHAAAALASNGLAALMSVVGRVVARAGVSGDEALAALLPLLRGTLENMEQLGFEHGLTGPVMRGDVETVRLHLATLEPREARVYRALGLELLDLARARVGEEDAYPAEALRQLLEDPSATPTPSGP